MKQFLSLLCLILLSQPCLAQTVIKSAPEEHLLDNKIYFFAHSMCHSCQDTYVYFYNNHQELDIPITDISSKHNLDLYKECVSKFSIKNSELTLPLICMGNQYVMGWEQGSEQEFEHKLQQFTNKN